MNKQGQQTKLGALEGYTYCISEISQLPVRPSSVPKSCRDEKLYVTYYQTLR
jgi:hypothetical protein